MNDEDPISKALDIDDNIIEVEIVVVDNKINALVEKTPDERQIDSDAELARKNIMRAAEVGDRMLDEIADVAGQSQHPRDYEVAFNGMKEVVKANRELLAVHTERKQLLKRDGIDDDAKTVNNTQINVGEMSTSDLLKVIRKEES